MRETEWSETEWKLTKDHQNFGGLQQISDFEVTERTKK